MQTLFRLKNKPNLTHKPLKCFTGRKVLKIICQYEIKSVDDFKDSSQLNEYFHYPAKVGKTFGILLMVGACNGQLSLNMLRVTANF